DAASALLGHRRSEVIGRRCWEVLAGCDAQGARICHEDCDVMRRERARQPVAWFDMRSPARAGRSVSLGVTTLSTRPDALGRRLITHLLCDLTKFARRSAV